MADRLGEDVRALAPFVKLAATITTFQERIVAGLVHGISSARVESLNIKIHLIIRRGFGFHNAKAIVALAIAHPRRLLPNPCPDGPDVTHGNSRERRNWGVDGDIPVDIIYSEICYLIQEQHHESEECYPRTAGDRETTVLARDGEILVL
jgi:hypothetical protein